MERVLDAVEGGTELAIARELGIVEGCIAMIAAGAAPRLVVGGLRFGAELLEPAGRLAVKAGVRVIPVWTAEDETVRALRFERPDHG
jgi:hypothetical protein